VINLRKTRGRLHKVNEPPSGVEERVGRGAKRKKEGARGEGKKNASEKEGT